MKPQVLLVVLLVASGVGAIPSSADSEPTPAALSDPGELDRALADATRSKRNLDRRLRELDREDQAAEQRTVAFGRAYVRASSAGLLPVAGGFEAFVDHAARVERLRKAAARELGKRRDIARERLTLRRQATEVESQLAVLRANQRAMAQAHSALLAQRDREAAFLRAFSSDSGHTAVYGAGIGPLDPALATGGFAAMKGRLPFPIAGRTEITRAARPGVDGPGLELKAPVGAPVNAVFPGRVAFADEYGAYGRTVIVDHGNRYFTVSAGLGEISVQARDEVMGGTRIGSVGLGPLGSGLYFEIRLGADTLDPDDWMGL